MEEKHTTLTPQQARAMRLKKNLRSNMQRRKQDAKTGLHRPKEK